MLYPQILSKLLSSIWSYELRWGSDVIQQISRLQTNFLINTFEGFYDPSGPKYEVVSLSHISITLHFRFD